MQAHERIGAALTAANDAGRPGLVVVLSDWLVEDDWREGLRALLGSRSEVFVIQDDGIAYVREGEQLMNDPGGPEQTAQVGPEHEEAAADETNVLIVTYIRMKTPIASR